jgi:hypothetical protein
MGNSLPSERIVSGIGRLIAGCEYRSINAGFLNIDQVWHLPTFTQIQDITMSAFDPIAKFPDHIAQD